VLLLIHRENDNTNNPMVNGIRGGWLKLVELI
jgi:hypothetical protein